MHCMILKPPLEVPPQCQMAYPQCSAASLYTSVPCCSLPVRSVQPVGRRCDSLFLMMASFFGEVIGAKSRAFCDSDDDLEADVKDPEFKVTFINKAEGEPSFDNKLFIVVHGPLPGGFAETCLLGDAVLVAEVNDLTANASGTTPRDYEDDLMARKKTQRPTKLYALKESVIICVCSPDLTVEQAHFFTECLSCWMVKSENVIILTCEFKISLKIDEKINSNAFLRELRSGCYQGPKLSKTLEVPNLIKGIPAGILTYCHIFKVPGVMYIVYADSFIADSITTQPLVEVFSKLEIKLMGKDTPSFTKRTYYGTEVESNLYM